MLAIAAKNALTSSKCTLGSRPRIRIVHRCQLHRQGGPRPSTRPTMGKPGAVSQPPDHRQVFLVPTSPRGLAKHGIKGVVGGGSADGGAMHQVVVA